MEAADAGIVENKVIGVAAANRSDGLVEFEYSFFTVG